MARFMRKGVTKIWFVPTIASLSAPTATEINGGTKLDPQLDEINGFNYTNNPIESRDMSTAFVGNVPGEDSVADSNMTFHEDKVTNPIKTALAKGVNGNIVIAYAGTAGSNAAAGDKVDVWPVTVASTSRAYTTGNETAKYQTVFAPLTPPSEEKAVV